MKSIIKFLKRYNELWLGPIGLVLFLLGEKLIREIDPQAVPYTMDALQKILFGHVVFAACVFSAWITLRLTWPGIFTYLVDHFNDDFVSLNNKSECENTRLKLALAFGVFVSYLLGLILCMQVL